MDKPGGGRQGNALSRRKFLTVAGSAGVAVAATQFPFAKARTAPARFTGYPFTLGVASGDPTPKGVVLWTRLAPDPLVKGGGLPADQPYEVRYELAWDEDFQHIHRQGSTVALPGEAHSVRVELDELPPEREWFYRFKAGDDVSPVGRTRTTPPAMSMVPEVTFAFVSCQHFAEGYFTPYADVAAADIEAVIFLGDYIYEGGARAVRAHTPAREVQTRDD
jgi:alkaline phosphatase D